MNTRLSKTQKTKDMQRSVKERLEERYGKFIPAPFTYRVGPSGVVERVTA